MNETEALALSKSIIDGTATESEKGIVLRNLQTVLSVSIFSKLEVISESISTISNDLNRLVDKFHQKVEENIDVWDAGTIYSYIDRMQSRQLASLDLMRKISQGRELFPQETLSEDEKKLIKLMNSFKSVDEKKKFLQVVDDMLNKPDVEDFDE